MPRSRIHFGIDSRSSCPVAKARPATYHSWCHDFYLRSPQMMLPSVLHISEAEGIGSILHLASWHIVFWVEKMWVGDSVRASFWQMRQQKEPAQESSCTCSTPDKTLPAPCGHCSKTLPPSASPPFSVTLQVPSPTLLTGFRTFSSLSNAASSTQVGRFTGASDQQVFSRWRLYLAKWRIHLLMDPLVPL